jgi:hypothetical protein
MDPKKRATFKVQRKKIMKQRNLSKPRQQDDG